MMGYTMNYFYSKSRKFFGRKARHKTFATNVSTITFSAISATQNPKAIDSQGEK